MTEQHTHEPLHNQQIAWLMLPFGKGNAPVYRCCRCGTDYVQDGGEQIVILKIPPRKHEIGENRQK